MANLTPVLFFMLGLCVPMVEASRCAGELPVVKAQVRVEKGELTHHMIAVSVNANAWYLSSLVAALPLWRKRNIHCIIFLIGEYLFNCDSDVCAFLINKMKQEKSTLVFINSDSYTPVITQHVRYYAAVLDIFDNTNVKIWMGDTDLYPVNPTYINDTYMNEVQSIGFDMSNRMWHKFSAPCDTSIVSSKWYPEFMMWYIGMPVQKWREVLRSNGVIATNDNFVGACLEQIVRVYGMGHISNYTIDHVNRGKFMTDDKIFSDQRLLTYLIYKSPHYSHMVKVPRSMPRRDPMDRTAKRPAREFGKSLRDRLPTSCEYLMDLQDIHGTLNWMRKSWQNIHLIYNCVLPERAGFITAFCKEYLGLINGSVFLGGFLEKSKTKRIYFPKSLSLCNSAQTPLK